MSLIACPDCGSSVSTIAASCPRCGRPIHVAALDENGHARGTRTIEQTAKSWKALQLCGALGLIVCVIGCGFTCAGGDGQGPMDDDVARSGLFVLAGLVSLSLFIVGRLGAWWYHG